jgi:sulfur-oxidizing protein SoxY
MKPDRTGRSRREFMRAAGSIAAGIVLESATNAVTAAAPAIATGSPGTGASVLSMLEAIHRTVGTAPVNRGKVKLELPPLVENGNAVGLAVRVESPMTQADHVKAIHVFSEKNPQPYIGTFRLGPRAGRASVATRVRLADTQTVVAICEMSDGSFWSDSANVLVTLAACTEEL